jgi:hypothetical protein
LLAPGVIAACERTHTADSYFMKFKRHTGAGGFVWSSTVQHHVAVAGDFQMLGGQLMTVEPDGAG